MTDDSHQMIDRYLDGALSPEETAAFDEALRSDDALRREFRSRVRLHGLITRHFAWEEAQDSLPPLVSFPEKSQASRRWQWITAAAAAFVLLAYLIVDRNEPAPAFGSFTTTDESIELKRYDFSGDQLIEIHLDSGIEIVIEAPASFQFRNATRLELFDGKLAADVPKGAEGFTVVTPRGEVIDLGTRFGVSVSEDNVETHVFEGEVEVRQEGKAKSVRLQESESMDLVAKTTGTSDSKRFPMPAYVLPVSLANPGFEKDTEVAKGMPATYLTWGGDAHQQIGRYPVESGSEQGAVIEPTEGNRMLQFLGTTASPEDPNGGASELWQVIDLTPYSDEVNRGGVEAAFSAMVNRVSGSSRVDRKFGIALFAFQGSVELVDSYWDRKNQPLSEQLASTSTTVNSDDDPATWELLSCDFVIPPNADYLVAQVYASEDNTNDATDEFEGHFADACSLTLTTRPRASSPTAVWTGQSGDWRNKKNWQEDRTPDGARDEVRIVDAEELRLARRVALKQTLWLGYHSGRARMRILPSGVLERSGQGELLLGHNSGGVAEMIVEGKLLTRGRVFIGRNNAASRLIVDGGTWESSHGLIRMAQYGKRDTVSELIVRNSGTVTAERIELVHDLATLTIESGGSVDVEKLRIGGDDGEARVVIRDGVMWVRELEFGPEESVLELADESAVIELLGEWDEASLVGMPGAEWGGGPGLRTESFARDGEMWTRVMRAR